MYEWSFIKCEIRRRWDVYDFLGRGWGNLFGEWGWILGCLLMVMMFVYGRVEYDIIVCVWGFLVVFCILCEGLLWWDCCIMFLFFCLKGVIFDILMIDS